MPYSKKSDRKGSRLVHRRSNSVRKSFRGNQYVKLQPQESLHRAATASTSQEKLQNLNLDHLKIETDFKYVILEFSSVFNELSSVIKCKTCDGNIEFNSTKPRGLGFKLEVRCSTCEPREIDSGPHVRNAFEINTRVVFAMRKLGVGYTGLNLFCALMDFHPFQWNNYVGACEKISAASQKVGQFCMEKASREEQEKTKGAELFQDPRAVAVSVDGSWAKRGFSSLFGLVAAIGNESNKVLDVVVKSLHCSVCSRWSSEDERRENADAIEQHSSECSVNYEGSSGSMEACAAVEIFKRSIETRGLIYKVFIGDGDTKSHRAVINANPYGDSIQVIKKECIAHVGKRMGSRLRALVKTTPVLKGRGKLTAGEISKLTKYYGTAIRTNPNDKEKMKKAIWATYYHRAATDEEPSHSWCPEGETSWCGYQRAAARHEEYNHVHQKSWSAELCEALKPIYDDMTRNDLLERCMGAHTQNNNESFHSTVWRLAPKSTFSGRRIVEIATHIAICTFNEGQRALLLILEELGSTIGPNCWDELRRRDNRRVNQANRRRSKSERVPLASKKRRSSSPKDCNGFGYGPGMDLD